MDCGAEPGDRTEIGGEPQVKEAIVEDKLSIAELMYLFRRDEADFRWQSMADSQEFLTLILYLVQRNTREGG